MKSYKIITAYTTYNRFEYLKDSIDSWKATRNPKHDWTLIVADDGSDDATMSYLFQLMTMENAHVIYAKRRGVHHLVNQIFSHASELKFDYGFRVEDDVIFKKSGWDDKYIEAIRATGYDHMNFSDNERARRRKALVDPVIHPSNLIASRVDRKDICGCLWTFTPRTLKDVGYFDTDKFNLCGFGHIDYTYRCCRAGYNDLDHPFDIIDSNDYVELIKENYKGAPNPNRYKWNSPEIIEEKKKTLEENRIYVPYNEHKLDLNFKEAK